MKKHLLVEGLDRLGKDTLIQGVQDRFGYGLVLHYQKPLLLKRYAGENPSDEDKRNAYKLYQRQSFMTMFSLLEKQDPWIICNRAHLGEMVYAHRYRGYSGDYVFDLECLKNASELDVALVLLYSSNFSFLQDDGQSFDVSKRDEEQQDFIKAFDRSTIKTKMMIDVHDSRGGFKSPIDILNPVCELLT